MVPSSLPVAGSTTGYVPPRPSVHAPPLRTLPSHATPSSSAMTYPHTSSAVATTSRSLARSCSSLNTLPSTVEEKPHWGERQSCSSGTYLDASSMRRFSSSLSASAPVWVVTGPSTTCLSSGTNRNGSKPPDRSSSYSRKKPSTSSC